MSTPALKPIYLSTEDHARLRQLLTTLGGTPHPLRGELDRAIVIEAVALPPGVVTLGSRVELKDLSDNSVDAYTLVMPERADPEQGRISILAPIGTAILGYAQGDEFTWKTPGGQRRLLIVSVTREADAGPKLPSVLG